VPASAALFLLLTLTGLRLLVAAVMPLSPDEAYYWVWSRALQPGYLDHPPMVALFIRAGTALLGETTLGIRLLAPIAALLGTLLLAQAASDLHPQPRSLPARRAGIEAGFLLNATLLTGAGAVTMTPDTPLLLFWTATLWAMARLVATGRPRFWLLAGGFAGLALCSKYSALLLFFGIGAWLLAASPVRFWLRRPAPWAGLGVGLALFLPVLGWNAAHHWVSLLKQGGRAGAWHPVEAARFMAELIGGQAGLATPLVFLLCIAGLAVATAAFWRQRDAKAGLIVALGTLPGLVFLEHALGDRVQGNWPAVVFPAAAIAATWLSPRWQRLFGPAWGLGFALCGLAYLQAASGVFPLPASLDPTLARLGGWSDFAEEVARAARQNGAGYIAAVNYGDAAELAYLAPKDLPVVGIAPRWAFFSLPDAASRGAATPGLLVESTRRAPLDLSPAAPAEITRSRRGIPAERYRLYLLAPDAVPAPAAILPRRGETK